ncbi:MAG: aminofutalosine synthase MqnE [Nitrospirae bacterium]|nr:aminofutalosine synthase MqnE [Nitrospirota bacterium]
MLSGIRKKVLAGRRITEADALRLFETDDIFTLGALASHVAAKKNGGKAFFIRNRHVNPTNICVNRCKFCAFSRSQGQEGAFELTIDEIIKKIGEGQNRRGKKPSAVTQHRISEVHIVGGLHPDWPFEHYLNMVSAIKKHFPKLHIKAFTAVEIDYFSKISGHTLIDTLKALKKNGLGSMPGGGAEIFSEGIRNRLCPEKIPGDRWIEVMEAAHRVGLRTNATMLYGHVESLADRVDHLSRLRSLQDRTKGFQAFIPLAYHPKNTEIEGSYTSGIDDLRTVAVSRIFLDNFAHIKAYWIMLGEKISQLALMFGADDIDGTIIEEKITHAAGALTSEKLTAEQLVTLIQKAGRTAVERDSFYKTIRVYT